MSKNKFSLCRIVISRWHYIFHHRKSLIYSITSLHYLKIVLVGLTGFEPVTLRLSSACSNHLSYRPHPNTFDFLEARGVEPLTYSLQSYRSTN